MKKYILFVIIILCLLPILTSATYLEEDDVLSIILKDIGGEFIEGDFNANGIIVESFLSEEELDDLGEELIVYFGLIGKEGTKYTEVSTNNYIKEKILEDNYRQVSYFGFDEKLNPMTIILSSYLNVENEKSETYLYINLINNKQDNEINDIILTVKSLFNKYEKNVEISTCIIGGINGKLSGEYVKNIFPKLLHNINGKIVDVYEDNELISYTAYTDKIEEYILAGEDRINLNIALRYNEYDNKTLIWIGTPIITSGY
ncbi:MAG: YwmB family TATA-box binding protein [Tissierellia bacterium]|jgi:hypothetical protein|nr:YwmB family TATA-box binding protein [Tissierellia bacterium]